MFTGNNQELTSDSRIKITWGEGSRRRVQGRQDYVKAHPILNAMVLAPGFDPLLDAFEIHDDEVDDFLGAMASNNANSDIPQYHPYSENREWCEYENQYDVVEEGYLHKVFDDNAEVEQLNALAALDTPCWVHFGHELFQDPKPCTRGKHCKHSHDHTDHALAELYKTRHRDTHLKMIRTNTNKSRSDNRTNTNYGMNTGRGHQHKRPQV